MNVRKVSAAIVMFVMLSLPAVYAYSKVEVNTEAAGDMQLIPAGDADWIGQTFFYGDITGRTPTEVNLTLAYAASDLTSCTIWLMNVSSQDPTSQMSSQAFANATLDDCSGEPGTMLQFNLTQSAEESNFTFTHNQYYGIAFTTEGGTGLGYLGQCSVNSPGCYENGSWWQGTDNPPSGTSGGIDLDITLYSEFMGLDSGLPPVLSEIACTSCNPPQGDTTPPYATFDTTPTFTFSTDQDSLCRIGPSDDDYDTMDSSRQCTSGEGGVDHICSLTSQDELDVDSMPAYIRIGCVSSQNSTLMNVTDPLEIIIPSDPENFILPAESVTTFNIANYTIQAEDIADDVIAGDKIVDDSIDGSKITDGSIEREDIADGVVDASKLALGTISSDYLSSDSVDSSKIIDGSIAGDDITDGSIIGSKLVLGTLTLGYLSTDSVDTSNIVDGTIVTDDIADNTITASKFTTGLITSDYLAADSVGSSNIVDGSITGDDIADASITSAKLASGAIAVGSNSVNASSIVDDSITSDDIANGTILSADLASDSVSSLNIIDGSVMGSDITDNTVNSSKIVDASIRGDDIASDTITASKFVLGTITLGYLASNSVNTTNIIDDSVRGVDIANGTITGSDISTTANVTVNSINVSVIDMGFEAVNASCSTASCTAIATCGAGKKVIYGQTSSNSLTCGGIGGLSLTSCSGGVCPLGQASCNVTENDVILNQASVYAVCARIV